MRIGQDGARGADVREIAAIQAIELPDNRFADAVDQLARRFQSAGEKSTAYSPMNSGQVFANLNRILSEQWPTYPWSRHRAQLEHMASLLSEGEVPEFAFTFDVFESVPPVSNSIFGPPTVTLFSNQRALTVDKKLNTFIL
jgi:hypothetical protein